jgi:hypothetical protein
VCSLSLVVVVVVVWVVGGSRRCCIGQPTDWLCCSWGRQALTRKRARLAPPHAGWDLACKLLCQKNELNRGRLSASQALRHPFLLLPA